MFLLCVLSSCEEIEETTESATPEHIELIDHETFVKVFAEAQLIESHIAVLRIYQPYYKDSVDHYFNGLFEKYQITTEQFYYSLKEYSKDPVEMDQLVTEAINLLKDMEKELGDVQVPNQSLNSLSRQQIGDIVFETPISDQVIEGDPVLAGYLQDSLFIYLDSFPDLVTSQGYSMESVRFSFVMHTSSKMMFNQLQNYLKGKKEKIKNQE